MINNKQLCCTCLSKESDNTTGRCINDHDDWIEPEDVSILLKHHKDTKYLKISSPHILPMFKRLAKILNTDLKQLISTLSHNPSHIFNQSLF